MSVNKGDPSDFPIPNFWEDSFWEPTVTIALKDYCRPGDTVFDVGANAGALSVLMSRYVGPSGRVLSFEASPRIISKTHYNIVKSGCTNIHLFYRAVYKKSHDLVQMFPGTHLNDSIYANYGTEDGASYIVETMALDDLVGETNIVPSFLKMDIEGAEYDALLGFRNTLQLFRPTLILELTPEDMRCHEFLTSLGYLATDLATYRRIRSQSDYTNSTGVVNVVFVHESKSAGDPYINASEPRLVAKLPAESFAVQPNGNLRLQDPFPLPAGRYLCKALFTANGANNEIFAGIDSENSRLFRYHTNSKFMAECYTNWIFQLNGERKITPYIDFVKGEDSSLVWQGAEIYAFDNFATLRKSVVF